MVRFRIADGLARLLPAVARRRVFEPSVDDLLAAYLTRRQGTVGAARWRLRAPCPP